MAKVGLQQGRAVVSETTDGIEIVIPARKNVFLLLFISFWLCGWAVGEVTAARQLLFPTGTEPMFFLMAWLGGWTLGGGFALSAWLWSMFGREVVRVGGGELQHARVLGRPWRSREYDLAHVSRLRVSVPVAVPGSRSGLEFWGLSGGTIAFDYGASTCRFGAGLDEAEAGQLVSTLQQRYALN